MKAVVQESLIVLVITTKRCYSTEARMRWHSRPYKRSDSARIIWRTLRSFSQRCADFVVCADQELVLRSQSMLHGMFGVASRAVIGSSQHSRFEEPEHSPNPQSIFCSGLNAER
jgi:hypothetical protein